MSDGASDRDLLLREFGNQLRELLMQRDGGGRDAFGDSVDAAYAIVQGASEGTMSRAVGIASAARFARVFPELRQARRPVPERLRTAVRYARAEISEDDVFTVGMALAHHLSALVGRSTEGEARWAMLGKLLGLVSRMPADGPHIEPANPLRDAEPTLEEFEAAVERAKAAIDEAATALRADRVPSPETLDAVLELHELCRELSTEEELPEDLAALRAELERPQDDPTVAAGRRVAHIDGPASARELIEAVRQLAARVEAGDPADDRDSEIVMWLDAVIESEVTDEDLTRLEELSEALADRGISPVRLARHLGDLAVGDPDAPLDVAEADVPVDAHEPTAESDPDRALLDAESQNATSAPEAPLTDPASEPAQPAVTERAGDGRPAGSGSPDEGAPQPSQAVPRAAAGAPPVRRVEPTPAPESTPVPDPPHKPESTPEPALGQEGPLESESTQATTIVASSTANGAADREDVVSEDRALDEAAVATLERTSLAEASPERHALARLIKDDPILAVHALDACDGPGDLRTALEALAVSRYLGGETPEAAQEVDRLLLTHQEQPDDARQDGPIVAAASIALALHAPQSTMLGLAQPPAELSHSLAIVTALQQIFAGVTRGALSRERSDAAVRQAQLDAELEAVVARAESLLQDLPKRESRHIPAKQAWRSLIAADGELGAALRSIADGTATVDSVQVLLARWQPFDRRLDDVFAPFGKGRQKVVSGVRDWLSGLVRQVLELATEWLRVALALQQGDGRRGAAERQASSVDERRELASAVDAAIAELSSSKTLADPVEQAAQAVLVEHLRETRAAIDGQWSTSPALPIVAVRHAPLARAWGIDVDEDFRPIRNGETLMLELVAAADRSAIEAARRQLAKANLALADAAVQEARVRGEHVDGLTDEIDKVRSQVRAATLQRTETLRLHAARLLRVGIIDASRHAQIEGTLDRQDHVRAGRLDLRQAVLELVERELYDAERSRLHELENKLSSIDAEVEDRDRIKLLLDTGDFAIAEDQIVRIERGERLAVPERPRLLESFYAAIAEAPHDPRKLQTALNEGSDLPGHAITVLSEDERRQVRVAITAIGDLEAGARKRQMSTASFGAHTRSVGAVAGLDVVAASLSQAERSPRGMAVATVDLIPGVAEWRPPHHVSPDGARQRRTHKLIVWGQVGHAQVLDELANTPGLPGLIFAATPLSLERRRQLERDARRRGVSFLLIDAHALIHAAIRGRTDGIPPLDIVVATSLALGRSNPYQAAGAVHPEMFMGRRDEARSVRDFGGAATVYGGRQLGKSALLRDIERAVNDPGDDRRPAVVRARYIDLKREGVGDRIPADSIWPVIATSLSRAGLQSFQDLSSRSAVVDAIEAYLNVPGAELRLFLDEADQFLREESNAGFPNVQTFRELVENFQDRFKVVLAGLHSVNRFRRIPNQPLAQLGSPERIGPLKWDEARELVLVPMEALGYRFEDDALVDLILVETRRHANLIQFACKRLVDHVAARSEERQESAPLMVARDDLAHIFERDDQFREWLRERFELTLNLYRHYKVLALLLAMEAHHSDEVRIEGLTLRELETLAGNWWPEGFGSMTPDEFTVVVEEMENLEVLTLNKATGRYRLPSVNLIQLLGGSEEIERHLEAEIERPAEDPDEGAQHDRRQFDNQAHSALTYDDERRILGVEARPLTVLLGARAFGSQHVTTDLERAAGSVEWSRPTTTRTFNVGDRLPALAPKHLLIARVRLSPRDDEALAAWLSSLAQAPLEDDRRIVLVFDDEWLPRWVSVLDHVDLIGGDRFQTLLLKRWNAGAFSRRLEELGASEERAAQWYSATGGYPAAANRLNAQSLAERDPDDLEQFADELVDALALSRVPLAARALKELADVGAASARDLQELLPGEPALVEVDAACQTLALLGLVGSGRDGYTINPHMPAVQLASRL